MVPSDGRTWPHIDMRCIKKQLPPILECPLSQKRETNLFSKHFGKVVTQNQPSRINDTKCITYQGIFHPHPGFFLSIKNSFHQSGARQSRQQEANFHITVSQMIKKWTRRALGHLCIQLFICSNSSLIHLLRTAYFLPVLCCAQAARLLAHSLTCSRAPKIIWCMKWTHWFHAVSIHYAYPPLLSFPLTLQES